MKRTDWAASAFIQLFALLIGNSMHPKRDERGDRYATY